MNDTSTNVLNGSFILNNPLSPIQLLVVGSVSNSTRLLFISSRRWTHVQYITKPVS